MIRSGALDQVLGRLLDDITEDNKVFLKQQQQQQQQPVNNENKNNLSNYNNTNNNNNINNLQFSDGENNISSHQFLSHSPLLSNSHGHSQGIIASLLVTTEGAVIGYATSSLYKHLNLQKKDTSNGVGGGNGNTSASNNLYGNFQIKPEVIGGMAAHLWCNNDCVGRELLGEYKGSGCLIMSCDYGKCIIAPIGCGMWDKSGRFNSNDYNGQNNSNSTSPGKVENNNNNNIPSFPSSSSESSQNGNDANFEQNRSKKDMDVKNNNSGNGGSRADKDKDYSNNSEIIKNGEGEGDRDERDRDLNTNEEESRIKADNNNSNIDRDGEEGIVGSNNNIGMEENDDITTSLLCLLSLDPYDGLILTKAKAMAAALEEALKQIKLV